jgi:hypothetical protein
MIRELGRCEVVGHWDDGALSFVVFDETGEPHPGVWSWDDVVSADARLSWARVLASAADRPTEPDVATVPSPATEAEAEAAFAEACARADWRVGVWALRGALPERLIGVPPWAVLRQCSAEGGGERGGGPE